MSNRPSEGRDPAASLLGRTVPAGSRQGASPEGDAARALAAAPHLLVTGGIALTGLAGITLQDTGGRFMAGLLLALLVIVALRVMAFLTKGMASEARYHALQASWWYVAVAVVLGVLGLVATGLGAVAFLVGALIIAVPSAIAAWRVLTGAGHRYPFVADRIDVGGEGRDLD